MSTATSPAPVTPPPRLGAPAPAQGREEVGHAGWVIAIRWAGDVLCVALLLGVFWWLSWHDGGRAWTPRAQVGLLAIPVVPFAVGELRRWPPLARWLILIWYAGLVLSSGFATDRTDLPHALVTFALVPVVGLASHRVWRRPWGPAAVLGLLLLAFGQYWYRSFMQWWGHSMMESVALEWRPLSWHNQSGTLMGAFGLLFGGIALTGRKSLAWAAGLATVAAFAGVWLSTSRGALVATGLGLVILFIAASRRVRLLRLTVVSVAVLIVAAAIASGLLAMDSSDRVGATPDRPTETMTAREEAAGDTFLLRLNHWESAVGMFVDAPLTGQGLASYRRMSLPFTPPDANLTVSPHNIYLRALAEGGLAVAIPLFGLAVAGGVLVLRRVRLAALEPTVTAEDIVVDDVRWPLSLGAAGAATMLLIHQGGDFDWDWPVLPALLAAALAITLLDVRAISGGRSVVRTAGRWFVAVSSALIVVSLVAGVVMTFWGNRSRQSQDDLTPEQYAAVPVSWASDHAMFVANDLRDNGHPELALELLERVIDWNPGVHDLTVDRAIILHELSELTDRELLDIALQEPTGFRSLNEVAQRLIEAGNTELADAVLAALLDLYPQYENWGIDGTRADTWYLRVRAAAEAGGCGPARDLADDAVAARGMDAPNELRPIEDLVRAYCD